MQLSWAEGLSWAAVKVRTDLQSSGGSAGQAHSVALGRIQFFMSCWTEGLGSSLAIGWRLP